MPKPSIPVKEKKVIRICIRFNDAEMRAIQRYKAKTRSKTHISTFLRQIALSKVGEPAH